MAECEQSENTSVIQLISSFSCSYKRITLINLFTNILFYSATFCRFTVRLPGTCLVYLSPMLLQQRTTCKYKTCIRLLGLNKRTFFVECILHVYASECLFSAAENEENSVQTNKVVWPTMIHKQICYCRTQ